jgi:hypothetical protein
MIENYLYLFTFRKNLALSKVKIGLGTIGLRHSGHYASAGDRPIYLATFSLRSD